MADRVVRVLFVCSGNICRSPTAEGVFANLVAEAGLSHRIEADSAGIGDWHVGEPPDRRAVAAARRRAIDISRQRARQVNGADFERFDLILAMDRGHLAALSHACPRHLRDRVRLFMEFAGSAADVPDPYYGGAQGFEAVLDMIAAGSIALLAHIRATHLGDD